MNERILNPCLIGLTIICFFAITPLKAEVNNKTLAVLVNINDPESLRIAKYYQEKRMIPEVNIIYLKFNLDGDSLSEKEFKKIEAQVKLKTPENVQAYALAWRRPWRVGCMSITSAFSLGYDIKYCAQGCVLTKEVSYFDSLSKQPFTDYKIRPSMMLSAGSISKVEELIDKGVAADYTRAAGSAYLLDTSDKHRNVRAKLYPVITNKLSGVLDIKSIKADAIRNKKDVMFYFTGLERVKWVDENAYLPGAVADHLTSTGGRLFEGRQMSILDWIDAGVTGSYGTVVEPCNFLQKFPHPGVLMSNYLSGRTLIESYWKSVKMPGQGVFVGEPLSSPYKGCELNVRDNTEYFYKNTTTNLVEKRAKNCN